MRLFKKPDNNNDDAAGNYKRLTVKVSGMHCEVCSRSIEKLLPKLGEVRNVQADFAKGEVRMEIDQNKVELEKIRHAIRKAGYIPGVEQIG